MADTVDTKGNDEHFDSFLRDLSPANQQEVQRLFQ